MDTTSLLGHHSRSPSDLPFSILPLLSYCWMVIPMRAPVKKTAPDAPHHRSTLERAESRQSFTPVSPEVTGRYLLLLVTKTQTQTKVVKQHELDKKFLFLFGLRSALFPYLRPRKQSSCSMAKVPLARKCMCLCGHVEVPRTKEELGDLLAFNTRVFLNVLC